MFTNVISPLSMHDVRRLAPASISVLQLHGEQPMIAAYAPKVVPVASAVLVAYQELDQLKAKQLSLKAASAAQTAVLNGVMLGWSGHLVGDIAGFEHGTYARNPTLTFDVLQTAISLKLHVESEGADLPYRAALLAELTARIESATDAAESAHAVRTALQEKQRQIRELTVRFNAVLVGLRRTVRAVLGSTHVDSQRLRARDRAVAAEPPDGTTPVTEPSQTETDRESNR